MPDPILTIRLTIQRRVLNIHILIARIEIYVLDCCGFMRDRVGEGYRFEEGWGDEVDVLAWVGEESVLRGEG